MTEKNAAFGNNFTPEQRSAALKRATEMRAARAEYLARRFLAKGSRQPRRERRRESCAAFQRRAERRHAVAQLGDHALQSVAVRIRQHSRRT